MLLLSPVAAPAQLPNLVPAPVLPVPVVPLPVVDPQGLPNVITTVKPVMKALTKPVALVQTVKRNVDSVVRPESSTRPLRATTSATSLLRRPLASTAPTTAILRPAHATSPVRPAMSAPRFEAALNRVVAPAMPPSPSGETGLAAARASRLQALVVQNPREIDTDDVGQPIIRGQIVLLDADPGVLDRVQSVGFKILSDEQYAALGLRMTTLRAPAKLTTRDALARVRTMASGLAVDFNHVFEPAGGALKPARSKPARGGSRAGPLIGMIDGGVANHPSLSGRIVAQKAFAGTLKATGHGTAVASLLVGKEGRFQGAASGARLLVADVYGGRDSAGSATAIARAMNWMSSNRPTVVNISLVGPRNELVRRAVAGLRARGIEIVAAVGNDGPAAPPQYPASYPGVTAVTGVDARGVVLFEAGNAAGLDFAAPGADMAAARPGKGYVRVRGTSFAAPLAAGRLAQVRSPQQLAAEARPGKGRVGQGIVCATCRTPPQLVGAR
jgi:hypothetical protein